MTLEKATSQTPHLRGAWKPGLQALRTRDRPHVKAQDTRQLTGSANVDGALLGTQPNAHRWDYGIGYKHLDRKTEYVYWVEIHTAGDKEVEVVLAKLDWLKAWLAGEGQRLDQFDREFIWISSGAISFTLSAPQLKTFAQRGLQHKGRVLRIPSMRG